MYFDRVTAGDDGGGSDGTRPVAGVDDWRPADGAPVGAGGRVVDVGGSDGTGGASIVVDGSEDDGGAAGVERSDANRSARSSDCSTCAGLSIRAASWSSGVRW